MRSAHVKCEVQMRVRRNEVLVLETLDDGTTPYRIWSADLHECPVCGEQVLMGFGTRPLSERHDTHFEADLARGNVTVSGRLLALTPERAE